MPRPTGLFARSNRLQLSRDFQRVGRSGARAASRDFVLLVASGFGAPVGLDSGDAGTTARHRLGVTASRKVGGAVVRNRVKRSIREWFRSSRSQCWAEWTDDIDIVVIARPGAAKLTGPEIAAQLQVLTRTLSVRERRKRNPSDESRKPGTRDGGERDREAPNA